jgi:sortase A
LADAWFFQRRESSHFERLRERRVAVPVALRSQRGLVGRLEIQRLGLSVMVMEGDDHRTLRRAVGHIPGTAIPGQKGNIALTGHRDTFFRPLRNIRLDDIVTLTTLEGEYRYRVLATLVVSPDNVSVLDPGRNEILTLITCYPFYFVGAAPNRFIVRTERIQ